MLLGLCALSVLLTVPHMQASSTLLLWARDNTNRHLLGWELPVPYVASLHAGLVLAVSPLLARALLHLKTTPGLPTAAAKIAIGVAATGLAYVPLVVAALLGSGGSLVGLGWLLGCLGLLSVGELLVGALGPVVRAAARAACPWGSLARGLVWLDGARLLDGRSARWPVGSSCLTACSSLGWRQATYGTLATLVHEQPKKRLGSDWPASFFRHDSPERLTPEAEKLVLIEELATLRTTSADKERRLAELLAAEQREVEQAAQRSLAAAKLQELESRARVTDTEALTLRAELTPKPKPRRPKR
jgi:hypothetical protein